MMIKPIFACLPVVFALAALAETPDAALVQTSGEPAVAAGRFYGYRTKSEGPGDDALAKAQALAAAEHVPLVVVWSEEDCSHCNEFIAQMNAAKDDVALFLSTNRAVFTFFKADTPDNDVPVSSYKPMVVYDAYEFATKTCGGRTGFPVFGFYFEKADGTVAKGGTQSGSGRRSWEGFKRLYLNWLARYNIHLDYHGGEFAASGTTYDRYEAEESTKWVDVELTREAVDAVSGVTNVLVSAWPDGTSSTNVVEWGEGETDRDVRVEIPVGKFAYGEVVALSLYGQDGFLHATNAIHFVCHENSNANPLWIGERTADALAFGEWTMDLDVATNKVAAFDGAAYTLVSVQGSQWCPDCGNVDRNFMDIEDGEDRNLLRAWAASNNVALVSVDIPNYNGPAVTNCATPSLLSRDAYAVAIARAREWPASGADPALTNKMLRSGRAYLSRKMVPEVAAAAARIRNHFIVSTNTTFGGYLRSEDITYKNGEPQPKYRTGVPIFVLLRKDGSVAARMTRFASVSPMASERGKWDDYIGRFDEMLEIATAEAPEIENNHWTTTAEPLTNAVPVSASISHCDTADWYELVGVQAGSTVRLHISGESTNEVTLAIAVADGSKFTTVKSAKGPLGGLSVTAELPVGERWFAGVTCANTAEGFAVDTHGPTLAAYTLESAVAPPDRDPGEIVFDSERLRVLEFSGTGVVQVVRRGGAFGEASARVVLRSSGESADGRFAWTDQVLFWRDGESGAKEVGFALLPNDVFEGEGAFTLGLEKLEGDAAVWPDAVCAVTIVDTDAPCLEKESYDVSTYATFASEVRFALLNVRPGDTQVTVSKTASSDPLPAGLKVAYDKKIGEVVLSGIPKKPGAYTFVCTVSVRRGGKRLVGFETTVTISVDDPAEANPLVAVKRPAQQLPLFAVDGEGRRLAAGLLNVAITSKGAISAKYSGTEGKAISFAGNWQDLDGEGAAVAMLSSRGATLALTMDVEGRLSSVLSLPAGYSAFDGGFTAEADWPQTGVFDAFKGYYTVALPQKDVATVTNIPTGGAILTLNMTGSAAVKNGTMRFAGVLPDGTSVSGSTTIPRVMEIPDYDSCAEVPVFVRSAKNVFGAVLTVDAGGADKWDSDEGFKDAFGKEWLKREIVRMAGDSGAYVLHREAALPYETRHEVYGSYYVPGVSPAVLDSFYESTAGYDPGAPFAFEFDAATAAASERYGEISPLPELLVRAGAKTLALDKTAGYSFSFSVRTGVFRGTARLVFDGGRTANGTFSGVLTPGWVLPCACGIVAPEKPFGNGVLWFRDAVGDGGVMRSIPVALDRCKTAAGEPDAIAEPPADASLEALVSEEDAAAGNKVTGAGNYKAGKKITLKAVAAKDWTFAGWSGVEGLEGFAALNPSLAYVSESNEVTGIAADFIHKREDMLYVDDPGVVAVVKGQAFSTNLVATLISTRSLPKVSVAGLPSGLKFDAKTFAISGTVGKAAKPGYCYATVAAKNASGYTFTRIVKFAVLAAAGDEIPEEPVLANDAGIDFSDLDNLVTGGFYPQDGLDAVAFFVNPATNGAEVASVKANGLPAGLKSAVAIEDGVGAVTIYGTPTKPGRYVLKVQVSYADRKKATSEYAFIVEDGGCGWLDVESFDAALGTVSGAGVYASGATVRLTARPGRGNVFGGWHEDECLPFEILAETDGVDCRAASVSFLFRKDMFSAVPFALYGDFIAKTDDAIAIEGLGGTWEIDPAENGELPFAVNSASLPKLTVSGLPKGVTLDAAQGRFVYSAASQAQIVPGYYTVTLKAVNQSNASATEKFSVFVANKTSDVIGGLSPAADAYPLFAGVALDPGSIAPEVDVDDGWKLAVAGLPAGLKLVQDKETKAYSVTGVATKAGTNTVTFTATKGKEKEVATITMAVAALPAWANGTFNGAYFTCADGETNAAGQVTLTVSAAGKVSGKLLTGGMSYSFAAVSFDGYDAEAGVFTALVSIPWSRTENEEFLLAAGVDENGVGSVFMEPTGDGAVFAEAAQNVWLRKDLSAPDFATGKKQPVLNLPDGIVCKFSAKGVVTLSGKVGTVAVSGRAQTLLAGEDEAGCRACLVVYVANRAFEGGALCEVVDVVLSDADGDGKLDKVVKNE